MNNLKNKLIAGFSVLGSVVGLGALAEADAEITASATEVATGIKENLMAVLTDNLMTIVIVGVFVLSITILWRVGKRFLK